MISKIKQKFIALSMVSLTILLIVLISGMNIISYNDLVKDADFILDILSQNQGNFPEFRDDKPAPMPNHMSPEVPHESRFFSVIYTRSGDLVQVDTGKIASVDYTEAVSYAHKALNQRKDLGFIGDFRYRITMNNNEIQLIFLDCGRNLSSFKVFLSASIGMSIIGLVAVFLIITYFAERIIRPIAESYDKQRRFITDAGHEMRTPLTIIKTNAELIEMEIGDNESLLDIKNQANRLTALTNDLIKLSKMEESEGKIEKTVFPLSDIITETLAAFESLVHSQKKEIRQYIQPMISFVGNPQSIEQLISILMDNAIKYSPPLSVIKVVAKKEGKNVTMEISNTTAQEIDKEELQNIFDRFYRMDSSRNSENGGYGIGLSIAKAIVSAHSGKISAYANDSHTFVINVTLPA